MLELMPRDNDLLQIVEAAMAEAVRKSGAWVVCKPGCTPCCIGPFPITQLDAERLRDGLSELRHRDPDRAARVVARARESAARVAHEFPVDTLGSLLDEEDAAEDEPCPALDPVTGLCDLYAARPMTCRTFGPAVHFGTGAVGACELCYRGATDEQIAQCRVEIDPKGIEAQLLDEMPGGGPTIVAFALMASPTTPDPAPPPGHPLP